MFELKNWIEKNTGIPCYSIISLDSKSHQKKVYNIEWQCIDFNINFFSLYKGKAEILVYDTLNLGMSIGSYKQKNKFSDLQKRLKMANWASHHLTFESASLLLKLFLILQRFTIPKGDNKSQ